MAIAISNVTPSGSGSHLTYMPMSVRIMLAATINEAWQDFSADMADEVDGSTPERFWEYLTR
jgi:hypothetical protein